MNQATPELPPTSIDRDSTAVWITLTLVVGGLTLASIWPAHDLALGLAQAACGTLACLALAGRRARPLAVAFLVTTLAAFTPMALGAAILAIVYAARRCRPRDYGFLAGYVLTLAAAHGVLYLTHAGGVFGQLTELFLTVPALVLGLLSRSQQARAEADQRRHLAQARAVERRRIAREMHDVLAHRISLVSVHAGALEVHPDAPAEEVAQAAGVIRASAHEALNELREVIALLRDPAEQDGDEATPPQPTLKELPQLLEESRAAGMVVALALDVTDPGSVSDTVARTVYRIVQEGLTNARKHAPGGDVQVRVADDADAGGLLVSVRDRGPAGVLERSPAATRGSIPTPPPGAHSGLAGLAERVAIAGGRLEHGATADGYELRATLPRS